MIKIVQGVYGFLDKDGIVRPKTEADEPFELSAEQEARLVNLGVAQYVGNVKDEQEPEETAPEDTEEMETDGEQDPIGFDETPPEDFGDEEIIDLETLTVKELRELGEEYGLSFKANAKKAEMIEAITAAQTEIALGEESEPAPVFDASEAVQ